ncbi:MAG: flagellar biosynthesis protein FliR [Synergistaceae bacterium]|nr:flagellar biosynthesis protein FliR [Synergistaceae bacterium]
MIDFIKSIPPVNLQALVALALFGATLLIARMVVNIQSGKWPGGPMFVLYLRVLLGFLFASSIGLGFYCFAGIDILFNK